MRNVCSLLLSVSLLTTTGVLFAQVPILSFNPVVSTGLSGPLAVVNAKDGSNRLFIVQQNGIVRIFANGAVSSTPFMNMADSLSTGGERGLLSLVFHPNYSSNRYFFVYYTNTAGDITVTRFQTSATNPNLADLTTGVRLLNIPKPFANHNGGTLLFGPDGKLYFGTGDGGSGGDPNNLAQNGNSLLGKLLRLDVDNFSTPPYYSIPADNPFVTDPNVRDEIYALGLRNPFRWSFDRLNNDMWIADVGENAAEEINRVPFASSSGLNYGWRCYEGNGTYNTAGCQPASAYTFPMHTYPRNNTTGGFSVTGGYVYRGSQYPAMQGFYICADYVSGNAFLITPNAQGGYSKYVQSGLPGSIAGFGESEDGELFAVSLSGILYRVVSNSVTPIVLQQFTASHTNGSTSLQWIAPNPASIRQFEVEYSYDGRNFQQAGTVNSGNSIRYSFAHALSIQGLVFYRLKLTGLNNRITYSAVLNVQGAIPNPVKIYPTRLSSPQIIVQSGQPIKQVSLLSVDGKRLMVNTYNQFTGAMQINLPTVPRGVYILQVNTDKETVSQKIIVE
jgi:glucose/arabinose dehydrogenase